MSEKEELPSACLICQEPAIDITFDEPVFHVRCLDCGEYEILELAARHIQEYSYDDRLRLLDKARQAAAGQEGPPLVREPFLF